MSVALMGPSGGSNTCTLKALDSYEKVLLWSNDSTTQFPGQTVEFSNNESYGLFYVECSYRYDQTTLTAGTYVPSGVNTVLPTFTGANYWYRFVTITAGKAVFEGGQGGGNNTITIPRRIYGLKGTKMK